MKITEKTKCWICGRNPKELKNIVEAFWESGELRKDMGLDAYFEIVSVKTVMTHKEIKIPICTICSALILQYVTENLREKLDVSVKIPQPKVSVTFGDEDENNS